MGTFFDPTSEEDKNLLSSENRDHAELTRVADQAEHDVIAIFEEIDGDGERTDVWLLGYDEDTDTATSSKLEEALRRTIAEVIDCRLSHYDDDPALASKAHGSRRWEYVEGENGRKWPKMWDARLTKFDRRPRPYHI